MDTAGNYAQRSSPNRSTGAYATGQPDVTSSTVCAGFLAFVTGLHKANQRQCLGVGYAWPTPGLNRVHMHRAPTHGSQLSTGTDAMFSDSAITYGKSELDSLVRHLYADIIAG
jgi:hypothetical protein